MAQINKILLLGEFSNLHNMLSKSLREYGIDSFVVGSPNGFRGLSADMSLSSPLPGLLGRVHTAVKPIVNINKLLSYDVVQAITYEQFHPLINDAMLNIISNQSVKFCSLSTGCDSYLNSYLTSEHPYKSICIDCLKFDQKRTRCITNELKSVKSQELLYDLSSTIIPMQLEYRESLLRTRFSAKVSHIHRLPFHIPEEIASTSSRPVKLRSVDRSSPIRIAHGLNRYGFKGTKVVDDAIKIIDSKGIAGIELIILPRMSLDKYLSVISEFDVVIDQLYVESYGYNALYCMSMGVPVISSTTDRALSEIGVLSNPFIFSPPDASKLVELLLKLKSNKGILDLHSQMGSEFVRTFHSPDKTVPQFLSTWSNL
jgi:glycosyltransferase involved in cell wall biosynthesis